MKPNPFSLALFLFVLLLLIPTFSQAGHLNDNALDHYLSGEKMNLRLEISGMYHKSTETSTYNRRRIRDDNLPRDYVINVQNVEKPVKSYLYILLDGFSKPSSIWTVEFNQNTLVDKDHSNSVGENPIGDGAIDIERQTILFDVTGMVVPADNLLTITDVDSPTKPYFYDGAFLLNFYQTEEEHQYWIYQGSEYLEKIDYNDALYEDYFFGVESSDNSTATLTTVYQNKEQEHDALYFNDNILKDNEASYVLSGSHIVVKSHKVTDILKEHNKVTFTMERFQRDEGSPFIQYTENPIYISLVILDVLQPPKQKVVLLANEVDLSTAGELKKELEAIGLNVIQSSADNFKKYQTEKSIIILGGPDALDGVGEIVKTTGLLGIDDADYLRGYGKINLYEGTDIWSSGQSVWVMAGSSRMETKQAHETYRDSIINKLMA